MDRQSRRSSTRTASTDRLRRKQLRTLGFRLIWRLYDLDHAVFGVLDGSGWQPPPVQACDTTGRAPDGTACAS